MGILKTGKNKKEITMNFESIQEQTFACNANGMNSEQRKSYDALMVKIDIKNRKFVELHNGFSFDIPSNEVNIQDLATWITLEKLCCPFFSFALKDEGNGNSVQLELSGIEGIKPFIRSEFGF